MKKSIFWLLPLLLLSSCGPTGQDGTSGGGDVSDLIFSKFDGNLEKERGAVLHILENDMAKEAGYLQELLDGFNEKYAEYGITAVDANLDEYTDLVNSGPYGTGPDVLYQANNSLMKYVPGKHILPIPVDRLECYEEVSEIGWDTFTSDENYDSTFTYGVPVNIQTPLLYYRKDLLPSDWETNWDDNKNKIPDMIENWNDMYQYSKQLKESSGGTKFGFMRAMQDSYFTSGFLFSYGAYIFGDNDTNTKDIGMHKGNAKYGAKFVRDFSGVMDSRCTDLTINATGYSLLANGEIFATTNTPDTTRSYITNFKAVLTDKAGQYKMSDEEADKYIDENLVITTLPKLPKNGDVTDPNETEFFDTTMMGGIHGYAISAYTKYPNACLAFLDYATSYELLKKRTEVLELSPAREDLAEVTTPINKEIYNMLENGTIYMMPSIKELELFWPSAQTLFANLATDGLRTSNFQYDTLEKIQAALEKLSQDVYDAIWTLQ